MVIHIFIVQIVGGRWDGVYFPSSNIREKYTVENFALDYLAGYCDSGHKSDKLEEINFVPINPETPLVVVPLK